MKRRLSGCFPRSTRWKRACPLKLSSLASAHTEADWRLFTTLVRFDAVYVGHFKCNKRRIADYPALSAYLRRLYNVPGDRRTVSIPHIKHHYYASHESINPTGIVPEGPELDFL